MPPTEAATPAITPADWGWLLHPIFLRCVDPEVSRYDLSRPFVIDEYVYATDGRIAVRMPTPEPWAFPNAEKLPALWSVKGFFEDGHWCLKGFFGDDPWRLEPVTFPPVEGACTVCHGAKVLPEMACPYCPDHNPEGVCEECYQLEGRIPAGPCCECSGTGLADPWGRVEVAPGYYLARHFIALLHEFEMSTYLPAKLGDFGQLTRFGIGDVTGVLMPMTRPDADWRPH